MKLSLDEIEIELKKRTRFKQIWGTKQNNLLDTQTSFIYSIKHFDQLIEEVKKRFAGDPNIKQLGNYAVNRWYNFWSAQAVESIFVSHPRVKPHTEKDKYCDFFIDGLPFDLKTTTFPKRANLTIETAQHKPSQLAEWYYMNQSSEQRHHFKNRLFLVVHNAANPDSSWTLKAEISWLETIVMAYLNTFEPGRLIRLEFDQKQVLTDIIWGIKH